MFTALGPARVSSTSCFGSGGWGIASLGKSATRWATQHQKTNSGRDLGCESQRSYPETNLEKCNKRPVKPGARSQKASRSARISPTKALHLSNRRSWPCTRLCWCSQHDGYNVNISFSRYHRAGATGPRISRLRESFFPTAIINFNSHMQ